MVIVNEMFEGGGRNSSYEFLGFAPCCAYAQPRDQPRGENSTAIYLRRRRVSTADSSKMVVAAVFVPAIPSLRQHSWFIQMTASRERQNCSYRCGVAACGTRSLSLVHSVDYADRYGPSLWRVTLFAIPKYRLIVYEKTRAFKRVELLDDPLGGQTRS